MQAITISQEYQMTIAKLLKQIDDLKQQLANTLEIGSHLASNLQKQRDENERLRAKQRIITDDLLKDARIRLEQLEKENKELRQAVKRERELSETTRKNYVQQVENEHNKLVKLLNEQVVLKNQIKKPRYTAVVTINDWHYEGKHFLNCKGGNTIDEAFANALNCLSGHYKLTEVPEQAQIGDNFFYANGREVNIIIVRN